MLLSTSETTKIKNLLEDLKNYVYVVGSYAKGSQTEDSDIDLYIKRKYVDGVEETYIKEIISVLEKHNVEWYSDFVGSLGTVNFPVFLDFSAWFNVNEDAKPFRIKLFDITMEAVFNID